jgi:hypothetical protein
LYVVVAILAVSLILFFFGTTEFANVFDSSKLFIGTTPENGFFYVFAIIFPAFTGMTAGVGLSGDLKDPKTSIPMGTLSTTIIGMIIYVFIALKLISSASTEDLVNDQLIMSKIALWGPIIPIGLAAATISSALGSFMVAPRTLQAIGGDQVFPNKMLNNFVAKGTSKNNEPRNATILASGIALVFVLMGDVNAVAEIISMFFMVTYGSLCLISFMQHFAADPSYRPSFKSKWYLSLLGAVMCVFLMFKINTTYAIAAIALMVGIYFYITIKSENKKEMATIFQGVIHQFSRTMQVFLQKTGKEKTEEAWRPAVICLSKDSFERYGAMEMMKCISHRYGFGTYIHFEQAYFSKESKKSAQYDLCILASSDKGFGYKKDIHVWISKQDYENANLMILLSYIILGHPDWKKGEIKIFATFAKENIAQEEQNLIELTSSGRLPISANNIRVLPIEDDKSRRNLINENSVDADLTIIGFHEGMMKSENNLELFEGYDK